MEGREVDTKTHKRGSIGFFGLQCTLPVKQFARKYQRFCAMQSKASEGKPTAQWPRLGQDSAWTCARKRRSCKLPQKKILNSAQCTELVTPETSSVQKPWPIADSQLCPCLLCVVPVQRAVQRTTQRCNLRRFVLAGKKNLGEWTALVSPKHKNHCKLQRCVVCCTVCCTVFRNVSHCCAPHYALLPSIAVRFNLMQRSLASLRHKSVHFTCTQVARVRKHPHSTMSLNHLWAYAHSPSSMLHPSQKATSSWPTRKKNTNNITSAQQH